MRRLYGALVAAEARLAGAFLVAMVALIFTGAVARLLEHPINWAIDVALCLFAWACFLSADIAWRRDALMSVDLLVHRLPEGARRLLRLLNLALISAFLVYTIVYGTLLAWSSRARSFQGMPEVSYSWVGASMPFGAALLLLTTLLKVRAELARRPAAS
jgi:TRAP-type C4-dicarboxylate transport system permease small subunit